MDWKEKIEQIKLNAITIGFDINESEELPIGTSKFGGRPDLPKDFKWYYFNGASPFTNEIKDRPLSFLAQINCREVKKYDKDNRLPKTGILYFFYELETMTWGSYSQDKGSVRVYYYDGDISKLVRTDFPKDMKEDFIMPEIKLKFGSKCNAPYFEEISENYNSDSWKEYDEILKELGYTNSEDSSAKLLGYSDNIQGDMLCECEMAANGSHYGDNVDYEFTNGKEFKKNKKQWKLLFQLDSVTKDDFELMFGDCGRIYYYIREEDLKNKNFDNTWLILQCG